MTNNKKMTKRDYFNILKAAYPVSASDYEDVMKFLDHELELLAKKNSSEKKPTATQTANEGIKNKILEGMEVDKLYTITDMIKEISALAELTNQKVSAIVRQMVAEGIIERIEDKRKTFFKLAKVCNR